MKNFIFNKLFLLVICGAMALTAFAQNNTGNQAGKVVRIGMPSVKTGSIGEGMNPQELAGAVQNSLGEYLKSPKIEIVPLDAKLAPAMDTEAKEKQCDYVLYATVSHKKGGGGGFAMFKKVAPVLTMVVPMAGIATGIAGAVASSAASTAISSAASASGNVKAKDELTLDIQLKSTKDNSAAVAKQFKGKAKNGGEDIISPMIEQAAQAIFDTVTK